MLDLVAALRQEFGTSVLFISHNLGVIRRMCERVGVLYAGRLVEEGEAETVFTEPRHPYTVGLLRCIPRGGLRKDRDRLDTIPGYLPQLGRRPPRLRLRRPLRRSRRRSAARRSRRFHPLGGGHLSRCHFHDKAAEMPRAHELDRRPRGRARRATAEPVVRLEHASKTFRHEGSHVRALVDVDLAIGAGETLGLVGESGCGKTTLARVLLGLTAPGRGLDRRARRRAACAHGSSSARPSRCARSRSSSRTRTRRSTARFSVRRIIGRALTKLARPARRRSGSERLREIAASVRFDERLLQRPAGAALRRPQAAGGDRARVRRRPARRRLRRADLRARRLRPGRDPQPARRPPGRARASPTSSSPTTSASSATSPTASPSSTSAG